MADKKYLRQRGGYWQFHRRLPPPSNNYHRVSLKTKSLKEAQNKRDQILRRWDDIIAEVDNAKAVMELRNRYVNAVNLDEREHIKDIIAEEAEEMAIEKGIWELIQNTPESEEDFLTPDQKEPLNFYRIATNQFSPLRVIVPSWLETIPNKATRADYTTAVNNLSQHFAAVEEINHERAAAFLEMAPTHYDVSKATVSKWQSGYINLWKHLKKDYSVWRNHSIPSTPDKEKPRDIWENSEVRQLVEAARGNNRRPWLTHAILIAAHTGAREDAIAKCQYRPEDQVVWFPKAKFEPRDRQIPVHPTIKDSLTYWMENRKKQRTISRAFTELKKAQGYGENKVFHSFRNTFIQHLQFNNIPEAMIAALVGHKIQTITLGVYGHGQQLVSTLEEAIHLIDYEKPDWIRTYI